MNAPPCRGGSPAEANGNFVQIEHYEVRHDVKATHVSGSIFMFTTIFRWPAILIRDMSGRGRLARPRRHPGDLSLGHAR